LASSGDEAMSDDIEDIDFDGPGPFAMPLLASFEQLTTSRNKDFAVAEFRFEDGSKVHVPISIQAAMSFAHTLHRWISQRADQKKN
jgi:hypothetical protein